MAQTTVMNLNNVAVVAANNTVNSKEEKIMANNAVVANEAAEVVLGFAAEKLETMKVEELKDACRLVGVKVSGKKAELIKRLTPFCQKDLEIKIVSAPVAEDEKWSKFLSKLCKEIMRQTVLFDKDSKTVVLDENHKVKLQDYALFYKPENGYNDYAVKNNRIWAVIAKVINNKAKTRDENIILVLNEMAKRDLLTISEVRTYITVRTADLSKEDKDFFRNLCASKDLKWEYAAKKGSKNESIKFTAISENGEKELANKYGKVTLYGATKHQMKNMMMLALQK